MPYLDKDFKSSGEGRTIADRYFIMQHGWQVTDYMLKKKLNEEEIDYIMWTSNGYQYMMGLWNTSLTSSSVYESEFLGKAILVMQTGLHHPYLVR